MIIPLQCNSLQVQCNENFLLFFPRSQDNKFSVFGTVSWAMDELDDNDIVDYHDDGESDYTLDTDSEEEGEEDKLRELDIDGHCRLEQAVYDLQYKMQSKTISNQDVEVKRIEIQVDRQLELLHGNEEPMTEHGLRLRAELRLQRKYFSSWGARTPATTDRYCTYCMYCTVLGSILYWLLATLYRMRTMKESLLTEFESFCDVEKFKLYILCGETRNYIRLGTQCFPIILASNVRIS